MEEEVIYVTEIVTVFETTELSTTLPVQRLTTTAADDSIFTPQIILGIAAASAVGIILIFAILIGITACRNKRKAKSYKSNDGQAPINLTNIENSNFNSAPKSEEHAWAYSNNAVDIMGDEGIEVDLDNNTEEKMKHLAETFSSDPTLGSYKPGKTRANFDRHSFYAEHQPANTTREHTKGNLNVGNPYEEGRPSSFMFFSGDLPATPL